MVTATLIKDSIKSVKKNKKRFITLVGIVLLGAGFFAGMKATKPDMETTADSYFNSMNFMDVQMYSPLGLKQEDLDVLKQTLGTIENIEGAYTNDVILNHLGQELVIRLHSIGTSGINNVLLVEGTMPINENECLIEEKLNTKQQFKVGDEIVFDSNLKNIKNNTYKITGIIKSPLYISSDRGTTSLLSGKVNYYVYIPKTNFTMDYFTEGYILLNNTHSTFSKTYNDVVDAFKNEMNTLAKERATIRFEELKQQYQTEINAKEQEYVNQKAKFESEIGKAQTAITNAYNQLKSIEDMLSNTSKITAAEQQIASQKTALAKAKADYSNLEQSYQASLAQINASTTELTNRKTTLELEISTLQKEISTLQASIAKEQANIATWEEDLKDEWSYFRRTRLQSQIDAAKLKIEQYNSEITSKTQLITSKQTELNQILAQLAVATEPLIPLQTQLNAAASTIAKAEGEIKAAEQQLASQKALLSKYSSYTPAEIKKQRSIIDEKQRTLDQQKITGNDELDNAQIKLESAKDDLNSLKNQEWYIADRYSNLGFYNYTQDLARIDNISKIFPLVFFGIAALVSLSSMTRMVEEERQQIGTFKAIGYRNLQIASKYILYASIATVSGGVMGILIGFTLIPKLIFKVYQVMYNLPAIKIVFNTQYALFALGIAFVCTVGATTLSSLNELKELPARLTRPKAPKAGKRILLEKMKNIWNKIEFSDKVTIRNLFRNKKRFITTIIGIMGCTSLIIVGFALRDSITNMIPAQYGGIYKVQIQINLKNNLDRFKVKSEAKRIGSLPQINGILQMNMQSVKLHKEEQTYIASLIVPESDSKLSNYIALRNRTTGEAYTLDDSSVIISEKIAKLFNIKPGNELSLEKPDGSLFTVKVSNITENYIGHYIYMSESYYQSLFSSLPKYNVFLAKADKMDEHEEIALSKVINQEDTLSSLIFISAAKKVYNAMMDNLSSVVGLLTFSAGLLAFIVLYNLFSINISERSKELATVKVLGFSDQEAFSYISDETKILTSIGIILGLVSGTFLATIVTKATESDQYMFNYGIQLSSYIYSILLTIFFATIVNITTYYTVKRIKMVESLKSYD